MGLGVDGIQYRSRQRTPLLLTRQKQSIPYLPIPSDTEASTAMLNIIYLSQLTIRQLQRPHITGPYVWDAVVFPAASRFPPGRPSDCKSPSLVDEPPFPVEERLLYSLIRPDRIRAPEQPLGTQ